jgi:peptidoglycan/xylan/chitin deacetylase (PgdA/CDA1 family)
MIGELHSKNVPRLGTLQAVRTADRIWALTFDDGPHRENTARILQVLRDWDAKATFFVLVTRATALVGLLREVMDEGHEIALHGKDHLDLAASSVRQVVSAVWLGTNRLEHLTGRRVRFFRPPYGTQTLFSYAVARASGMEVVGWSSSPRDFLAIDVERQSALALEELGPGGIMLLHDGGPSVPAWRGHLLETILRGAARDGWMAPVSVSQLLASGEPIRRACFLRRPQAMEAELEPFYLNESGELTPHGNRDGPTEQRNP